MASSVFDREALLDLTVNIIPLGILLFFIAVFAILPGFGYDPFVTTIQMSLLVIPFIGLAALTYVSGKAITQAERELEE
ncbi:DUF6684 family protein [Halocatena pleomorpha]|uniref:Cox cluster protein n=1 Tax=Halocatena pleomorpha TaxID=1785090 RepID=A0A3P3RJ50_9EURY|nr:DUF6684 family protein [Halocatena pleomorpha]RRJ32840.1 hypothetical protein EIK79_04065 [Halocatena pleomorpha]